MYGPTQAFLLGHVFQFAPVSKVVPQAMSLISAFAMAALGALTLRAVSSAAVVALAILSFLAIDNRIGYFAEGRPDMLAWLLAYAGLILMYLYYGSRSVWYYVGGIALIVAAVSIKQTMAMLVLVPPVALYFERRDGRPLKEYVLSIGPAFCVVLLIAALWLFAKDVFHYMFVVARAWPVNWEAWPKTLWLIAGGAPCIWFALAYAFRHAASFDDQTRRQLSWWLALLVVTLPLSIVPYVKLGGGANSLFPAWVAIIGLSWHLLATRGLTLTDFRSADPIRALQIFVFSLCISLTLMPEFKAVNRSVNSQLKAVAEKNAKYAEVLGRIKELDGLLYAPEDPTLVLYTKNQATRALLTEYDALVYQYKEWPIDLPEFLRTEFSRANYIVNIVGSSLDKQFSERDLLGMEFVRQWTNGRYEIWGRQAKKGK